MSAYRFCRTDDIGLLVDALNRCWLPHFPDQGAVTPAAFKRSIRDLQVWCSSCMVAFAGSDPIGVLIGAKRSSGTLIHTIAVHPDHLRQGHGRHLLASLSSKLAILGPPRIVAEVPATLASACALFTACGYRREALLTDYVWQHEDGDAGKPMLRAEADDGEGGRFVIPITVDDLSANGLLENPPSSSAGHVHPQVCWERSVETLTARKNEIAGLAVASDERIEACLLYVRGDAASEREAGPSRSAEVLCLRTFVPDGGPRLEKLLTNLRAGGIAHLRLPRVHPAELPQGLLEILGFNPAGGYLLCAAQARST